jgi:drug/metabolite transporter (DMT)-like permease
MTLSSKPAFARSLRSTADKLGKEAAQIGFGLALFGLAIGGIYLILGKQDAPTKITSTVFGILILSSAPSLVSFIKGIA